MEIQDAIAALRKADEPVPKPLRLPSPEELDSAEQELGLAFPSEYKRFLLEASDVTVGTLEPLVLTAPGSHIDLVPAVRDAWEAGVPKEFLPFCEDNGNFFCLHPDGRIVYWDHDGVTEEEWQDLATWISDVWLDN